VVRNDVPEDSCRVTNKIIPFFTEAATLVAVKMKGPSGIGCRTVDLVAEFSRENGRVLGQFSE
jgi:hypothetical protein